MLETNAAGTLFWYLFPTLSNQPPSLLTAVVSMSHVKSQIAICYETVGNADTDVYAEESGYMDSVGTISYVSGSESPS